MAITISGSGITSANIADGTIVNADVNDVAASKLTGALPAIDGSSLTNLPAGGIAEADQWRLTTTFTGNATPITTNLERNDTSFEKIGTGMAEASGIFTFPSTGKWYIEYFARHGANAADDYGNYTIQLTTDNSTYSTIAGALTGTTGAVRFSSGYSSAVVDITNTSTHKVRFNASQANTGNYTYASTTQNHTAMTFLKLGDT